MKVACLGVVTCGWMVRNFFLRSVAYLSRYAEAAGLDGQPAHLCSRGFHEVLPKRGVGRALTNMNVAAAQWSGA